LFAAILALSFVAAVGTQASVSAATAVQSVPVRELA